MDKLTIFDSESANMNAVIDVICDALPTRRIISSGPDLLIEFNASSNITAKGFRGKFKFIHNEIENPLVPAIPNDMTTGKQKLTITNLINFTANINEKIRKYTVIHMYIYIYVCLLFLKQRENNRFRKNWLNESDATCCTYC